MNNQNKADELQERLIAFAVRIIKLTAHLPKNAAGWHVSGQLLRCGTSPAPNYGEARGAESRQDFLHKLGIVLKELNESAIWLQIIVRSQLVKPSLLDELINENRQLAKIIAASHKTTRSRNSSVLIRSNEK